MESSIPKESESVHEVEIPTMTEDSNVLLTSRMTTTTEHPLQEQQLEILPDMEEIPPAEKEKKDDTKDEAIVYKVETLLEQGKFVFGSWTSTDAGLPEFQKALEVLRNATMKIPPEVCFDHNDPLSSSSSSLVAVSSPSCTLLESEVLLWKGRAHQKLWQYSLAVESFQDAIQVLEHHANSGRYCNHTQYAYNLLAKAHSDQGSLPEAIKALWISARIEQYRSGPLASQSRTLFRQALLKNKEYSSEEVESFMGLVQDSVALEIQGDLAIRLGKVPQAVEAYTQAFALESQRWGVEANPNMAWLQRKSSLALIYHPHHPQLLDALNSFDSPVWVAQSCAKVPNACHTMELGDRLYASAQYSMATMMYFRAVEKYQEDIWYYNLMRLVHVTAGILTVILLYLAFPYMVRFGKAAIFKTIWLVQTTFAMLRDWAQASNRILRVALNRLQSFLHTRMLALQAMVQKGFATVVKMTTTARTMATKLMTRTTTKSKVDETSGPHLDPVIRVTDLPHSPNLEVELQMIFQEFGRVKQVHLVKDTISPLLVRCAYIEFANLAYAEDAMEQMDGKPWPKKTSSSMMTMRMEWASFEELEEAQGQQIIGPAVDGEKTLNAVIGNMAHHHHHADQVASSLETLGSVFAGFETTTLQDLLDDDEYHLQSANTNKMVVSGEGLVPLE